MEINTAQHLIAIVNAFVSDVITPLMPVSNSNFADWTVPLPYGHSILKIGAFMNAVIRYWTQA
jgi:large-conductance mechanosensitive channel